uniref:ATP-dependent Clp protease proteolytic subunit n=1 Tax=Pterospora andromedea TaxID=4349 RepID=A0A221SR97_PTEAN|nr:ATP-dependent Clp protease proteolytic subunit [Pterospora andromedea]
MKIYKLIWSHSQKNCKSKSLIMLYSSSTWGYKIFQSTETRIRSNLDNYGYIEEGMDLEQEKKIDLKSNKILKKKGGEMTFYIWEENKDKDKDKDKENELNLEIPKVLVEEEYFVDLDDDDNVEKDDEENFNFEKDDDDNFKKNDDEPVVKEEKKQVKKTRKTYMDVYRYLYKQKYIFLGKDLTKELGDKIIGQLLSIAGQTDPEKPTEDVFLHVSCVRGCTRTGITLFDVLQGVPMDMNTLGSGWVASVGTLALIGGSNRLAYPHTRITLYLPRPSLDDIPRKNYFKWALEELERRQEITNIYIERTGQPVHIIEEDVNNMSVLSPEEAQKFGIIDKVFTDGQNFGFPKTNNLLSEDESSEKDEDESSDKNKNFWYL